MEELYASPFGNSGKPWKDIMTTDINWHIEHKLIKDLIAYSKNPRILTKEQAKQLEASIDNFGLIDLPIVNTTNLIMGGHQRIKILKKKKIKSVDCWVPNRELTEKEINELCIRLNRNIGEWDYDLLANEFEATDLIEWGFTPEELFGDPGKEEKLDHKLEDITPEDKLMECPECGHIFPKN